MRKLLVFLPILLTGCSTITNLTPSQYERNSTGLYPVEMAWASRQQSIRDETIEPKVLVGMETYPMKPVPLVRDRWETLIPVAPNQKAVYYRFKTDYLYNAVPVPRKDSKLSREYRLEIIDK